MSRDMNRELMRAIINWLFDHEHEWNREVACIKAFEDYIYDKAGNYLIGGDDVLHYIRRADSLIFSL